MWKNNNASEQNNYGWHKPSFQREMITVKDVHVENVVNVYVNMYAYKSYVIYTITFPFLIFGFIKIEYHIQMLFFLYLYIFSWNGTLQWSRQCYIFLIHGAFSSYVCSPENPIDIQTPFLKGIYLDPKTYPNTYSADLRMSIGNMSYVLTFVYMISEKISVGWVV